MITLANVAAVVASAALGCLAVLAWNYTPTAWRTVKLHVAVLIALTRHRRYTRREWEESPLAHPEAGWEDDPDSLRDLPVVRVPDHDELAVDDPDQSGRHRKGEAA